MKKITKKGREFKQAFEAFIKSGRSYVGLISLLEDVNLKPASRVLFHIISSLSFLEGFCFATNETLGEKLGLKKSMVKQYLEELKSNEIIEIRLSKHAYGIRREIYIRFDVLKKRYNG